VFFVGGGGGGGAAKERLLGLRDSLCQRLRGLRVSKLSIVKPSYAEKNNLYTFLPFSLDGTRLERFLNFYKGDRHNKHIDIQESKRKDGSHLLEVTIDPDGIDDIYGYIRLKREEVEDELSRFATEQFGELVDYYTRQLYERLPNPKKSEDACLAYYRIRKAANNRREFFNSIPDQLKREVIERARAVLSTLVEFHDLAQWRYDDIINMLVKLAKVSKKTPINLYLRDVNLKGYVNNTSVDAQTMVGLEFSDEFRKGHEKEFGYKMPCDSLHHICHFVQPAEALKAIYDNNEDCLLQGGPVIAEY